MSMLRSDGTPKLSVRMSASVIDRLMDQCGIEPFFTLVYLVMRQDLKNNQSNKKDIEIMFTQFRRFMDTIPEAYRGLDKSTYEFETISDDYLRLK